MVPRIITNFGIELIRSDNKIVSSVKPLNLSEKGLCVQAGKLLDEGESLSVIVELGPGGDAVKASVKVVWRRHDELLNVYFYGLGFVGLEPDQRQLIIEYVEQGAIWLLEFLSEFPLFSELSHEDCQQLLHIITLRDLAKNEVLYRAGESDTDLHGLFIIHTGLVNIYKSPKIKPDSQLATVSAGQIFGESSLVIDQPHTATVVAVNNSRLIQISKAGFIALKKKNPALGLKIMEIVARALVNRLGRTTSMLFRPI